MKFGKGKLSLPQPPDDFVRSRIAKAGWFHLPIELDHVLSVFRLPDYHRDPFDRLIVSQSKAEGIAVLTVDPRFADYGITCLGFSDLV